MSIALEEQKLFDEWSVGRHDFVRDGVVDPGAFGSSAPRILFVLKEVNDPGGGGWDLREFLREGARSQTWNVGTWWVRSIRALPGQIPWSSLDEISEDDRVKELRSIAAMNLKKSPGGHTSDSAEIEDASRRDAELIRRQFELYEPDLAICCGSAVSDGLERARYAGAQPDWKATTRGVWFYQHAPGARVISFSHPEARVAQNILHYSLVDAVQEICGAAYQPLQWTNNSSVQLDLVAVWRHTVSNGSGPVSAVADR